MQPRNQQKEHRIVLRLLLLSNQTKQFFARSAQERLIKN